MPATINTVTADKYSDAGGATIQNVYESPGGWCTCNAQVFAQLLHSPAGGQQGSEQWSDEFVLPAGAHYIQKSAIGIRFRSFTAGSPVQVTAAIFFRDEPAMVLGGSGIATPSSSVAALNFQHNDVAVATEPTADFEDGTNFFTWTVVDDVANTRVKITPVLSNQVNFPGSVQIASQLVFAESSSTNTIISASATGDTNPRYSERTDGLLQWGPGNAAADASLSRSSANVLDIHDYLRLTQRLYTGISGLNVIEVGNFGANPIIRYSVDGGSTYDTYHYRAAAGLLAISNQISVNTGTGNGVGTITLTDRIFCVGAAGTGGMWVYPTANQFVGSQDATHHGFYNGTWAFVVDSNSFVSVNGTFGYLSGVGVGGTVTQITSLSTAVTNNHICGSIVCFTSAISGNLNVSFTVNNNKVSVRDSVIVNWAACITGNIPIWVSNISNGSFVISYTNLGGLTGSATDIINFMVLKGTDT